MKLGSVPYKNAIPLTAYLDCDIYWAPPSQLPRLAGPDDIILAPIVAAFEDPSLYILEGVGIGSFGPVDTVKLFFNKTTDVKNIRTISLDTESKTSVALLKILLHYWTKDNGQGTMDQKQKSCRSMVHGPWSFVHSSDVLCDAALLIGDKVWEQGDKPALDLGQAWTEWTGLPFVYACWMTKNQIIGKEWKQKLITQAQKNLENLEKISTDPKLLKYWRQLVYEVGPKQKEGIQLFQKYWWELEKKEIFPLKWI
ncbi:MAG: MqnA/MqnD/SBP family protein [Deltaproteobacteria bacterium]|nr:MqnA/MqnD/SBP family protein [Deltaproteobacteria bacterium]